MHITTSKEYKNKYMGGIKYGIYMAFAQPDKKELNYAENMEEEVEEEEEIKGNPIHLWDLLAIYC